MLQGRSHLPLLLCIELCPALAQLGVHVCVVSLILRVHYLIVVVVVSRIALSIGVADKCWVLLPLINFPPAG